MTRSKKPKVSSVDRFVPGVVSLDEAAALGYTAPSGLEKVDYRLFEEMLNSEIFGQLSLKEREVLQRHYNLDGKPKKTVVENARDFGISRSTFYRRLKSAEKKIQHPGPSRRLAEYGV